MFKDKDKDIDNQDKIDNLQYIQKLIKDTKKKALNKNKIQKMQEDAKSELNSLWIDKLKDNNLGDSSNFMDFNFQDLNPEQLQVFLGSGYIGAQNLALLAQQPLIAVTLNNKSYDCVKDGYSFQVEKIPVVIDGQIFIDSRDEKEEDNIAKFLNYKAKEQDLTKEMQKCVFFNEVFGIRVVLLNYDIDDETYLLDKNTINPELLKGKFKGLVQIDPYYCMPAGVGSYDSTSPNFYEADSWNCLGKEVHKSWLIICKTIDVPAMYKQMYRQGGIPTPQMVVKYAYGLETGIEEIGKLLLTKRIQTLKTDLEQVSLNPENFVEQQAFSTSMMDNYSRQVIGLDDHLELLSTSLSDVPDALDYMAKIMASIMNVPLLRMIADSPKGLNATGVYETKTYMATIDSIRQNVLTPVAEAWANNLLFSELKSKYMVSIIWNNPDTQTALEKAQSLNETATSLSTLQEVGLKPEFLIELLSQNADLKLDVNSLKKQNKDGLGEKTN